MYFVEISIRRRHALMVADGAFSHKIDYVTIFLEILNLKGHPNCIAGSRDTDILLNWWILPIGETSAVEGLLSTGPTPSSFVRSWLFESRGDQKYPIWVVSGLLSDTPKLTTGGSHMYTLSCKASYPQIGKHKGNSVHQTLLFFFFFLSVIGYNLSWKNTNNT